MMADIPKGKIGFTDPLAEALKRIDAEAKLAAAMGLLNLLNDRNRRCPFCGSRGKLHRDPCSLEAFLADPDNAEVLRRMQKAEQVLKRVEDEDSFKVLADSCFASMSNLRRVLLADKPKED